MAQQGNVIVDVLSRTNGSVISQVSGASQTVNLNQLSIVRVHATRAAVLSYERAGNDLILHMQDGSTVRYHSFFNTDSKGHHSELIFDDGVHPIEHATFVDTGVAPGSAVAVVPGYETVPDVGALLLDGSNFDPAILGALLGVVALGAGIAIAASNSGGGGGGSSNNGGEPGQPGQPGGSDKTPTLTLATFAGDNVLNKAEVGDSQVFSGTTTNVTAGQTVTLTLNGKTYTTTTAADGSWSITLPAGDLQGLADGTYVANVSVTGTDGQTITKGVTIGVDTTAPGAATDVTLVNDANQPITGPTNDNSPTLSGKAEPGSTVTISDGGTVIGTVPVDGNGNWTFTPNPPLGDGDHSLTAEVTDPAGNTSPPSTPIAVVVDTTAPAGATDVTLVNDANQPITGATNDTTPTITGKAEAGSTVTVRDGDTVIGSTVADGNGNWSVTPTQPLGEGNHSITTEVTDPAGNSSGVSAPIAVEIDTTAPGAATDVTLVNDANEPITGSTNDNTPTLSGKAEPGSTVTVSDGGTVIGTAPVDGNGNWTFTPNPPLGDGDHSLTVVVTDPAGNSSPPTTPIAVVVDASSPSPATDVQITDGENTPIGTNGSTNDTKPTISGKAEADSAITIRDGDTVLGTVKADGSGNWSLTLDQPLSEGPHSITTEVTDAAGNSSGVSTPIVVNIDTIPPAAATAVEILNGDGLPVDGITNDTTPTVSGKAEAGSKVIVRDGNTIVGSAIADENGNWSVTLQDPLSEGPHGLTTEVRDAAGNSSGISAPIAVEIDTTAPGAATDVKLVNNDDLPIDGATNDTTPTLSGKAEVGSTVTIRDGDKVLATVPVDGEGNWSYTPAEPLAEGPHSLTTEVKDAAGNSSGISTPIAVDVDTIAPNVTIDPVTGDNKISFNEAAGIITITGTASASEAGRTLVLNVNGDPHNVIVGNDGKWSFDLPAGTLTGTNGDITITATLTDAAGNTGTTTDTVHVAADPALQPSLTVNVFAGNDIVDGAEIQVDQKLTGSTTNVEAGNTVTVTFGDKTYTGIVGADGTWSVTIPATALHDVGNGSGDFDVKVSDSSGNEATATRPYEINDQLGGIAIDPISVDGNINAIEAAAGVTISGTTFNVPAGPGAITVNIGGVNYLADVAPNGTWSIQLSTAAIQALADGKQNIEVSATDGGGNPISTAGSVNVYVHNLPAPTLDTLFGDGTLNGSEAAAGQTITGNTGVTGAGQSVTVIIGGQQFAATVANDGTFSVSIPSSVLSSLPNGTAPIQVIATDVAGNSQTINDNVPVDTLAPTLTINPLAGDGQISLAEAATALTLSGTASISEAGREVTITLNNETYTATVGPNGVWSVELPAGALNNLNGDFVVNATLSDAAGNSTTTTNTIHVVSDPTIQPTITINPFGGDNAVDGAEVQTAQVLNGTTANVEAGQIVKITLNGHTYTAEVQQSGSWSVIIPVTDMQVLTNGTQTISVEVADKAGNSASGTDNFTVNITENGVAIDPVTGDNVINAVETENGIQVTGTTYGVPVGTDVVVTFGTVSHTVQVLANGRWSVNFTSPELAGIDPGTTTVSAVTKDANGNTLTNSVSVGVDNVAPEPTINTPFGDGFLNITEAGTAQTLTGSTGKAGDGQTVTVTLGGHEYTATVGANGSWTISIPSADLKGLPEGSNPIVVVASDSAGNSTTINSNVTVDLSAPTLTVNPLTADGIVSSAEAAGALELTGTASVSEAGKTITVTLNGATYTGLVGSDGNWTVNIPAGVLNGVASGQYPLTVSLTDEAGNTTTQTSNVTLATGVDSQPTLTLNAFAGNNVIDGAERLADQTLSGTTTHVEAGQQVNITLNGKTYTATVGASGAWSVQIPAADLTALTDGSITLTAEVADKAGNPAQGSLPLTINTELSGLAIDPITGDNKLSAQEAGAGINISGTSHNVAEGANVTVTLNGKTYIAAVGADGTWTVPVGATDLALLGDGPLAVKVTATDAAGNAVSSTVTLDVYTHQLPTPTINTPFGDGLLSTAEAATSQTLSGSTGIVGDGQTVTVTLGGKEYTATVGGNGQWTVTIPSADLQALPQSDNAITVTAADAAGNSTPLTSNVTVDFTAPTLTIDPISGNGYIDAAEAAAAVTLSGSTDPAEAGRIVTLTINGQTYQAEVGADGKWTTDIPANSLLGLANGQYTLTATLSDAAGNSTTATESVGVFTQLPVPVLNTPFGDGVLSKPEAGVDQILTGNTGAVGPDQKVTVNIGGQDYTGTVGNDGTWSVTIPANALNNLTDGSSPLLVTVTDPAGNTGTTTTNVTVDLTAPTLSVDPLTGDDKLNTDEVATGFLVQGTSDTGDAGRPVTVSIDGHTYTGVIQPDGSWSVLVPPNALSDLTVGDHPYSVSVTDAAGNQTVVDGSVNVTGVPSPLFPSIDAPFGDTILNGIELAEVQTLTGTTGATGTGQTVKVNIGGLDFDATVGADGHWTLDVPANALASLPQGPLSIEVTATSASGATGSSTIQATVDTVAPTLTVDLVAGDDIINAAELLQPLTLTGTASVNDSGQSVKVSLVVGGVTYEGTVGTDGKWSVPLPNDALQALGDGPHTITATLTDAAGNTTTINHEFTIEAGAAYTPTLAIDTISGDDYINATEKGEDLVLSGTSTKLEEGREVTLTFNGKTYTAVVDGEGKWTTTVPAADLAGLGDGQATITANATSLAGNPASATHEVNVLASEANLPTITIDKVAGDDVINSTEHNQPLVISGTSNHLVAGETINITLNGKPYTAIVGDDGKWSTTVPVADVQALQNQEYTITATGNDVAENVATGTHQVTVDTTPPLLTIVVDAGADGIVNAVEAALGLPISGTAPEGTTVTVTVDGKPYPVLVPEGGNWTLTIPAADLKAITTDGPLVITATVTDAQGNVADVTVNPAIELAINNLPVLTLDPLEFVNITTAADGFTITGTSTNLPNGTVVQVSVAGVQVTGTVTDNVWTATVAPGLITPQNIAEGVGTVTVSYTDAAGNPASASHSVTVDLTPPVAAVVDPLFGDGALNKLESGVDQIVTGKVAPGDSVVLTLDGKPVTAVVGPDGTWTATIPTATLLGLTDGQNTLTVAVTDAAGNSTSSDVPFVSYINTLPTATITDSFGGTINIDKAALGGSISGTTGITSDGQKVTVNLNGKDYTADVNSATGTWVLPLDAATLQGLPNGTWTATVTVTDVAGNSSTQAENISVQLTPPPVPTIDLVFGDGVLNAAEAAAGQTISGSTGITGAGQIVTVTFAGIAAPLTATVGADGKWTLDLTVTQLADIAGLATHSITVTSTDQYGNSNVSSPEVFTVDLNIPNPSITNQPFGADNVLNIAEAAGPITIAGTTGLTGAGQAVKVVIDVNGTSYNATVLPDGTWTLNLPAGALSGLTGGDHTINITATDASGNTKTVPVDFTTDFTPPVVAVTNVSTDGYINLAEAAAGTLINGTTDGTSVNVNIGGKDFIAAVSGGTWVLNLTAAQIATLPQGSQTITVTATDASGNTSTAISHVGIATDAAAAPTVTVGTFAGDNILDFAESRTPQTISGTTAHVEAGRTVNVTVGSITGLSAIVQADGSWSLTLSPAQLQTLSNGATNITANVSDLAGNAATPDIHDITVSVTPPAAFLTLNPISVDNIINSTDDGGLIMSFTGQYLNNQTVLTPQLITVFVNGVPVVGTFPALPSASGTWTIVGLSQLVTFPTDGNYTVTVSMTGLNGTTATVTQTVVVDRTPPTLTVSAFAGDDVLNGTEAATNQTISGTASTSEIGRTVTVTLNGKTYTALVGAGGAWSTTVPAADLQGLPPGTNTISASLSDAAGNTTTTPHTFTTNTTAPLLSVGVLAGDNVLNLAEGLVTQLLTGTSSAEAGQTVTIKIAGVTVGTAVIQPGGAWSAEILPTGLSGLLDGPNVLTASVTDKAGNTTSVDVGINVLFNSLLDLDITSGLVGGVLNAASLLLTQTIGGVATSAGVGAKVSVEIGGQTITADVGVNGQFNLSIPPTLLANLPNGPLALNVVLTDAAGNTKVQVIDLNVAKILPVLGDLTSGLGNVDHILNTVVSGAAQTVSGALTAADGTIVKIAVGALTFTGTVVNNAFSIAIPAGALASLADGVVPVILTATDAAGNVLTQALNPLTVALHNLPQIVLDPLFGDGLLNAADILLNQTITGVVKNVAAGTTLSVQVGAGAPLTAQVDATGHFSVTVPANLLSGLTTGNLGVNVSLTDSNGNTTSVGAQAAINVTLPTINLTDVLHNGVLGAVDALTSQVIGGVVTGVTAGTTVKVTLGGKTFLGVTDAGGKFAVTLQPGDLKALADGTLAIGVSVVSDAGNVGSTNVNANVIINSLPKVVLDPLFGGNGVLNAAEALLTQTISGTVLNATAGSSVKITLGPLVLNGTVDGTGHFNVQVTPLQLSQLLDGNLSVGVTVTDAVGNTSGVNAGLNVGIHNLPSIVLNPIFGDGVLSVVDLLTGQTISGVATNVSVGSQVQISLNGKTYLATVGVGGAFSVTVPPLDLKGILTDGLQNVTATFTDAVGNVGTITNAVNVIANALPTITLDPLFNNGLLNAVQALVTQTISGKTTNAEGSTVTVTIGGASLSAVVKADGTFSVNVLPSLLSTLLDGTVGVGVSVTNAANHTVGANANVTVGIHTLPTLNLGTLFGGDGFLNLAEASSNTTLTGTTNVQNGSVSVNVGGVVHTGTITNNTWNVTFTAAELKGLADGATTVKVTITDAVGNITTQTSPLVVKTHALPLVSLDGLGSLGGLIGGILGAGLTLKGSSANIGQGGIISVTLLGTTIGAVVQADGSWQAKFSSEVFAAYNLFTLLGALTGNVVGLQATDLAGNGVNLHVGLAAGSPLISLQAQSLDVQTTDDTHAVAALHTTSSDSSTTDTVHHATSTLTDPLVTADAGAQAASTDTSTTAHDETAFSIGGVTIDVAHTQQDVVGTDGNDIIVLDTLDFGHIDGGAGVDTLQLGGTNQHLDLTLLGFKVEHIDIFDLGNSGTNSITLNLHESLTVKDAPNDEVIIKGGEGSLVNLVAGSDGAWTETGQRTVDGLTFDVYHNASLASTNTLGDVLVQHGLHVQQQS
ncbi:Ig-like domain-containing protein [Ewingella americana]|nr:Ig-like domain-containing protein [Ewingella americana]KAA8730411.1 Ig-like domain-containing protein [Ewingella americana]